MLSRMLASDQHNLINTSHSTSTAILPDQVKGILSESNRLESKFQKQKSMVVPISSDCMRPLQEAEESCSSEKRRALRGSSPASLPGRSQKGAGRLLQAAGIFGSPDRECHARAKWHRRGSDFIPHPAPLVSVAGRTIGEIVAFPGACQKLI